MSTLDGKTLGRVSKLKGTENYDVWAIKTAQLLIKEDLYDAIEPIGKDKANKSFFKEGSSGAGHHHSHVRRCHLEHAKGTTTAKELSETLKGLFSLARFSVRHLLLQGLVETSLGSHWSVTEFVEEIKRQGRQLKELNPMVPDWIFVSVLLHGLRNTYKVFVNSTI